MQIVPTKTDFLNRRIVYTVTNQSLDLKIVNLAYYNKLRDQPSLLQERQQFANHIPKLARCIVDLLNL